jgi:diadenosine tetraphosphatase ApaH/serine/threonine PP2A family protein phosphatase
VRREALRRRVRLLAQDTTLPYLWQDEDIDDWLNEAQQEAAIRARLLRATPTSHPALCEFSLTAGETTIALPDQLYEISYQEWQSGGARRPLKLVSREWMDTTLPGWRAMPAAEPDYLVQDRQALEVVPPPIADGAVLIEGYRLPEPMELDDDEPRIPLAHHIHLVLWALHIGYSLPDAETLNPGKSQAAEAEFTRYFGARPDADLRADTRNDETHRIVAW